MTRKQAIAFGLAAVLLGAATSCRGGGDNGKPPLVPPKGGALAAWIGSWQSALPITASVSTGVGRPAFSSPFSSRGPGPRTHTVTLSVENRASYPMTTGADMYLLEVAKPGAGGNVLQVIGGAWRRDPVQDYGGVAVFRNVDRRGFDFTQDLRRFEAGLFNTDEVTARGARLRAYAGTFNFLMAENDGPPAEGFGVAVGGSSLAITADLELGVVVPTDRLERLIVVTPELRFAGSSGRRAAFRILASLEPGGLSVEQAQLVPVRADTLGVLAADTAAPTWKRVLAAGWLAAADARAAATPLRALAARGNTPDAVRLAALHGLGVAKDAGAVGVLAAIGRDATEHRSIREQAVSALGMTGTPAALAPLRELAAPDSSLRPDAYRALGWLGDRTVTSELLAVYETSLASDVRSALQFALKRLVTEGDLDRLTPLLGRTAGTASRNAAAGVDGDAVVELVGVIPTARAVQVLRDDYAKAGEKRRQAIINAIAENPAPAAADLLRLAALEGNGTVAESAAGNLARVVTPERTAALRDLLARGDNLAEQVARSAGNERYEPLVPDLVARYRDPNTPEKVRSAVERALKQSNTPDAREAVGLPRQPSTP